MSLVWDSPQKPTHHHWCVKRLGYLMHSYPAEVYEKTHCVELGAPIQPSLVALNRIKPVIPWSWIASRSVRDSYRSITHS
jgi:hypothetical protein